MGKFRRLLAAALIALAPIAAVAAAEKKYEMMVCRIEDEKEIESFLNTMSKIGYELDHVTSTGSYLILILSKEVPQPADTVNIN